MATQIIEKLFKTIFQSASNTHTAEQKAFFSTIISDILMNGEVDDLILGRIRNFKFDFNWFRFYFFKIKSKSVVALQRENSHKREVWLKILIFEISDPT